jgi:hypothetical protein
VDNTQIANKNQTYTLQAQDTHIISMYQVLTSVNIKEDVAIPELCYSIIFLLTELFK